jgi:hypothetical protein
MIMEWRLFRLHGEAFFPSVKKEKRQAAIDDNLWAIDQAFLVRAPVLVWFAVPMEGSRSKNRGSK